MENYEIKIYISDLEYILQTAYMIGKINNNNQLFYDAIVDSDIDDTLDWYRKFYKYIYNQIINDNNIWNILEYINNLQDYQINQYLLSFIAKQ